MSDSEIEIEMEMAGEGRKRNVRPAPGVEIRKQACVEIESEEESGETLQSRNPAKPPGNPETIKINNYETRNSAVQQEGELNKRKTNGYGN